jgi:hypothetical protein
MLSVRLFPGLGLTRCTFDVRISGTVITSTERERENSCQFRVWQIGAEWSALKAADQKVYNERAAKEGGKAVIKGADTTGGDEGEEEAAATEMDAATEQE